MSENIEEQKEGIVKPEEGSSGMLYFDPFGIKTFADLTSNMVKKVAPQIRKQALENFLSHNNHETFEYKTISGEKTNIWVVEGARYDTTEFHIAEKLAKSGQHVLFPRQGDLGTGRRNDIFLYDAKTFIQQKVELKALFGETAESLRSQIESGTAQASVIAYDIQSNIKKMWLIDGLRKGWGKETKKVLLNYKGQWYEVNRERVYNDWLERNLK